jgi:hypothetical protein
VFVSSILDGVASVLDKVFSLLPGFGVDTRVLSSSMNTIVDYVGKANKILPIDTLFAAITLFVAYSVAMAALWAAMRLINLVRGAG